eukprot:5050063-Pyramimonas_sp.AAC.1
MSWSPVFSPISTSGSSVRSMAFRGDSMRGCFAAPPDSERISNRFAMAQVTNQTGSVHGYLTHKA